MVLLIILVICICRAPVKFPILLFLKELLNDVSEIFKIKSTKPINFARKYSIRKFIGCSNINMNAAKELQHEKHVKICRIYICMYVMRN